MALQQEALESETRLPGGGELDKLLDARSICDCGPGPQEQHPHFLGHEVNFLGKTVCGDPASVLEQ